MSIAKNFGAKIAATLIMAFAACLLSANMAFASQDFEVQCTASNDTYGSTDIDEVIDIDNLYSTGTAVYGMYYKSSAWNVLGTTQYATFPAVVQAALNQHNTLYNTNYSYSDVVWNDTGKMTLTVIEDGATEPSTYTKYYPTLADMTTRLNFYGDATNNTTTLTGATSANAAAVFTKHYGSGVTASGAYASSAAASALANQADVSNNLPRLITGCEDNMTTSNAMGKRYPWGIVGISF